MERQEFLVENTLRNRLRSATPEVWERMGLTMEQVLPNLHEAATRLRHQARLQAFQRAFFSKLVPNVRKLGLLEANDGYLRRQVGRGGAAGVRVRRGHRRRLRVLRRGGGRPGRGGCDDRGGRAPGPGVLGPALLVSFAGQT